MARPQIFLHQGDLPDSLTFGSSIAVDTESLGLNVTRDRLCVVQLSGGDGVAHLVRFERDSYHAPNLKKLLVDPNTTKLFHYARADLAMIYRWMGVMPGPIYCTKVASIIARTFSDRHGLKDLCRDLLSIELSKEQQTSDWGAPVLSSEQQMYAATDVLHLHALKEKLDAMLSREGREGYLRAALDFLPTRAALDVAGWGNVDIFAHKISRT